VAVEVPAGPVVAHGGTRVGGPGGNPHVAQAHTGVEHGRHERVSQQERMAVDLGLACAGERYHLNTARIDVDLWPLHAAIDRATATGDLIAHRQAVRTVVVLYTGELAAG
jgi:hypothetical protein